MNNNKRDELIKMVIKLGISIKKGSKILKINYSTAKHIVKQYKLNTKININENIFEKKDILKENNIFEIENN